MTDTTDKDTEFMNIINSDPAMVAKWHAITESVIATAAEAGCEITADDCLRIPSARLAAMTNEGVDDTYGTVSGLPIGFEGWCDAIGDGEGRLGFNRPIYSAAISFLATYDDVDKSDFEELHRELRAAIKAASRDRSKDRSKYDTDTYLTEQIENAWDFVQKQEDDPAAGGSEASEAGTGPENAPDSVPEGPPRTGFRAMKPVICKVHRQAVAGGSDISLCADLTVMGNTAQIGYMPTRVWGCPTTAMWVHRLGPEKAKHMMFK